MSKLRVDKIAAPIIKDEYTGSVYFDGTGDYLQLDGSSDFAFGTGDFNIELWVYIVDSSHTNTLYDSRPSGSNGNQVALFYSGSSNAVLLANNGTVRITGTVDIGDSKWHHISLSRQNGVTKLYVDGVQDGSYTDSTNYENPAQRPFIGASGGSTNLQSGTFAEGYISNLRVCKGHAVYTENFTPPTRELEVHTGAKGVVFPAADNRTVLLACQDAYNPTTEATGRHTITGAGNLGGVPGQNLVTNGQFSQNTNNWTADADATLTISSQALRITVTSTAGATQTISVQSGARYVLTFDAKTDGTNFANFQINNNGTFLYNGNITSTGFEQQVLHFTASSSSITIKPYKATSGWAEFDNISISAVHPVTDANPGLLRKTNTTSTITETTGSVYFDNSGDYLVPPVDDDELILGDTYSVEWWHNLNEVGTGNKRDGFIMAASGENSNTNESGGLGIYAEASGSTQYIRVRANNTGSDVSTPAGSVLAGVWQHCAVQVNRNYCEIYIDGVLKASGNTNGSVTQRIRRIGSVYFLGDPQNSDYATHGYISNLRICKGHVVYTSNFTPPTRELEAHTGSVDDRTVLLCCYDGENIFAEKTGRILRAVGDRKSSPTPTATDSPIGSTTVTPGLTREVDPVEGPTFGGGAGFTSQNWLTLPKGTTTQRSRGRGLVGGGYITNYTNTIEYIEIHTLGNGQDFGDLSIAKAFVSTNSSSTRCVFSGGYAPSASRSEIEYVNISTTGNVTNFGTALSSQHSRAACGSNTRGIIASGSASNIIEYITFSTLGNSKDFGDYAIGQYRDHSGCSSPTRGIFAGGFNPTNTNSIQYVTISTVGNSQDFGDLSSARGLGTGAASSATRGVFFGGSVYPSTSGTNIIEYITISTQGNTTDFGDLTRSSYRMPCTSNGTRAVAYTSSPSPGGNAIEYVTIATTGNASDFGDSFINAREYNDSASSDSHGGIS